MLTMRLGDRAVQNFQALLELYPDDALASPMRSTVPLLDYWRGAGERVATLAKAIGDTIGPDVDLCFECRVPVQAGRGKPSCTDLMICSRSNALAVEGKYKEPRYETVREWLRDPVEQNRRAVLHGWFGLIEAATSSRLTVDRVADLPYQLIHRTASACAMDSSNRGVIYQLFGNGPIDHYVDDLLSLSRHLAFASALRFMVLACPFTAHAEFKALESRWARGERSMGKDLRRALIAGPLFSFGNPSVVAIA
jgi:hypothetical protein